MPALYGSKIMPRKNGFVLVLEVLENTGKAEVSDFKDLFTSLSRSLKVLLDLSG